VSSHLLHARDLLISVDRSERLAPGRQIEAQLRDAIRRGMLLAGSGLPSTRALAEDLSVSRGVVVRAYAQLAAEGYLEVRQGATTSVRGGHTELKQPVGFENSAMGVSGGHAAALYSLTRPPSNSCLWIRRAGTGTADAGCSSGGWSESERCGLCRL
jgi:Bacterial regulatory proteins, gntR family